MLKRNFLTNVLSELTTLVIERKRWTLPNVDLLPDPSKEELSREVDFHPPVQPDELVEVLKQYGIQATFKDYHIGCAVTTYEVAVPIGTHLSTITRYSDDLARDLGTPSLRIIKSSKDSSTVGFEVENKDRYEVHFKQLFKGLPEGLRLPLILGEDTYGSMVYRDLTAMPHLLVAGQPGSGKSAFLNILIATLICRKTPQEVCFLIVDPKQVEFVAYSDIPHMFQVDGRSVPIAFDPDEARHLLDVAVEEMDRRFGLLRDAEVKKIEDYNLQSKQKLPYIVFIVDEFSDLILMGTSSKQRKELSDKIVRLAQKARAAGIHMVLSTQKPLAEVMSSLIKGNIPARIAFSVASGVDSRGILDESGAETLTGRGDMLFRDPNARGEHTRLCRVQAPWLSDEDVKTLLRNRR